MKNIYSILLCLAINLFCSSLFAEESQESKNIEIKEYKLVAKTPQAIITVLRGCLIREDKVNYLNMFYDIPNRFIPHTLAHYEVEREMLLFHQEYIKIESWDKWRELYQGLNLHIKKGLDFSLMPYENWEKDIKVFYSPEGYLAELRDENSSLMFFCFEVSDDNWKYDVIDTTANKLLLDATSIVAYRVRDNLKAARNMLKSSDINNEALLEKINNYSRTVTKEELEEYRQKIIPKYSKIISNFKKSKKQ